MSRNEALQVIIDAGEFADDSLEEQRVYRVVQEALRNASRHSGAAHTAVRLGQVRRIGCAFRSKTMVAGSIR
jgi:signal transduction histidine kinase